MRHSGIGFKTIVRLIFDAQPGGVNTMNTLRWRSVALVLAAGMLATSAVRAADDGKKKSDTSDDLGTYQVGSSQRMKIDLDDGKAPDIDVKPSGKFKMTPFKPKIAPLKPNFKPSGSSQGGSHDVQQPSVVSTPAPIYPDGALKNRLEGYVVVAYTIGADGETADIQVADSSPPGVFDLAARQAVARWEFKPYMVDGEAKPKRVKQKILFNLPADLGAGPDVGASPGKSGSDHGPQAVYTPAPAYPPRAAQRRINGYVVVQYTVNTEGQTENVQVLSGQPSGLFDRNAVRAVERWRFKPAVENGKPVARVVKQRIDFSRN